MASIVLLLSASPSFAAAWSAACAAAGLAAHSESVDTAADLLGPGVALVIDAESDEFDEDELLAWVGFARARDTVVAVAFGEGRRFEAIEDVITELCGGLVARHGADGVRIAEAFVRRGDRLRGERFEYLSVAPTGDVLIAILGDGTALSCRRPLSPEDDGSAVSAITLAPDARTAQVALANGAQISMSASAIAHPPRSNGSDRSVASLADVDGVKLGQRLRDLRQRAGLTQAELARRTGIHRPNIARVEAGRHTPSLETLARLAAAIGVSTTRVLTD